MKMFEIKEHGTSVRTEIVAGITTFMTMAYIIFVNPAILSVPQPHGAGMNFEAVMAATCLSSAITTMLMAFLANYPIALAPGMGMNALFSFGICGAMKVSWDVALGIVFLSGVIFILLTGVGIREMIFKSIPDCLKFGTAAGIGLFIAFIGFKDAGIVVAHPETLVTLGNLTSKPAALALFGLLVTSVLIAREVRGGILWGLLTTGIIGALIGIVQFEGAVIKLPSLKPTIGKMNVSGALSLAYLAPIFTFLYFAMFDAIGTLVGVGEKAGLIEKDGMKRLNRALLADATGSAIGAFLGTSTVTAYIESASGVSEGGRTGLANLVTATLFLVALFFGPIAVMFGGGYKDPVTGHILHPVTAPALIVVGSLMAEMVVRIRWSDVTEAMPAFLTIVAMPLTFSISNGLALGFASYPILKLVAGRGRDVHWLVYILAAVFISRYILLP